MCPKRDLISSFEKVDGCFAIIGNDHPCKVEWTVHIKMFDGMIRELKGVRYVPQLKEILCRLVP